MFLHMHNFPDPLNIYAIYCLINNNGGILMGEVVTLEDFCSKFLKSHVR